MMSIVNQSYDRQMTEAAGAVLPALINGLGDIAQGTVFLAGAVKDIGNVLYAGVQIGKVNATPFDERLRNLLDKYRPVADSMQRAYAPTETDLEDIGAKGESNPMAYARLVTDPIKAAGGALEGFFRQSPADQVAALMRVDGQIVGGGALAKAGEGIAEATPVAFRSGVKALREKMDLFNERHAAIREQFQIRQPQFAYAGAFAGRGAREYEGVLKMTGDDSEISKVGQTFKTKEADGQAVDGRAFEENWGTGPLRKPAREVGRNEGILIDASYGLQSSNSQPFNYVLLGSHGEPATKYLWTIDERGINVALEQTEFPTKRKHIVHTNLSSEASIGGEAWFNGDRAVTINAGSGRFGDKAGVTPQQWEATIKMWESLGYKVKALPVGSR